MTNPNYRFYVKPLTDNTNEQIAARLNELGDAAFTAETQKISVAGKDVLGVYQLPHKLLTEISRTEHHSHVCYYVQEGEGESRPYTNFRNRLRSLSRTNVVKTAAKALKQMRGKV